MSRYPSRLSRNELYSYGFKEGQPWGDDRRVLESALRAMNHLERDTRQHYRDYAHNKSSRDNISYPPTHSTRHRPAVSISGYYSAQQYPTPDICLTRSNESYSSSNSSGHTPWPDTGYDAPRSTGYRDPKDHSHRQISGRYPASQFHRSLSEYAPQSNRSYSGQYLAPPLGYSRSRSGHRSSSHHEEDISPESIEAQHYPITPSRIHSRHSGDGHSQPFSPSQMQLVVRNSSHAETYPEDDADDGHYTSAEPSTASPNWSMNATRDTASGRSLSVASSQGVYSDADSAVSGYTASSGYVESYDVASHEDYRGSYHHDGEEENDFMSDGVASDEGDYYSSGDEPDFEEDGEDVFSDSGYSEPENDYEAYD